MNKKVNFLKIMGLVGMVTDNIIAIEADGKVTITEGLSLIDKICNNLSIKFDIPDSIIEIVSVIEERMRDSKTHLSIEETVDFMKNIYNLMGVTTDFKFDEKLVEYLKNYNA